MVFEEFHLCHFSHFRSHFGPHPGHLGPLGLLLGPLGRLLGILGRPKGSPWRPLVGPRAPLGALLTPLGGHLRPSWGRCEPVQVHLVLSWAILEPLDAIRAPICIIFTSFWLQFVLAVPFSIDSVLICDAFCGRFQVDEKKSHYGLKRCMFCGLVILVALTEHDLFQIKANTTDLDDYFLSFVA